MTERIVAKNFEKNAGLSLQQGTPSQQRGQRAFQSAQIKAFFSL